MFQTLAFWAFASISVLAALLVVLHPSLIYAALGLISVFLAIAGLFLLNNADFLAVAQTLVYGVGLTIVILFGIMFTGDRPQEGTPKRTVWQVLPGWLIGGMLGTLLVMAVQFPFATRAVPEALATILGREGTVGLLGRSLFGPYALPFELASVLLLLAMVGAILLSKKPAVAHSTGAKYAMTAEKALTPDIIAELEHRVYAGADEQAAVGAAVFSDADKVLVGATSAE